MWLERKVSDTRALQQKYFFSAFVMKMTLS